MDNGNKSAFPVVESKANISSQVKEVYSVGGCTKREYFAAMAMQGLLSDPNYTSSQGQGKDNEAKLAEFSVKYADELLKALEK